MFEKTNFPHLFQNLRQEGVHPMRRIKKLSFLRLDKRGGFIFSAIVLSSGLLGIQFINASWRYQAIGCLGLLTFILSAWALREGLTGIEWFSALVLPVFFTLGVGLFSFLIPPSWFARIPIALIFGFGVYVLLLTENIFSVAAIRNIQLLRSAQAVGFLLTLVISFLLFNASLSFRFLPWINFLLSILISFPLAVQSLWSINLEEKITRRVFFYSLTLSVILAETILAFSFWPVTVAVGSLGLVTVMYVALGLFQHQLSERLFKRTIMEYTGLGLIILLVIIFSTHWGG
jgi:hypothetical protein